MVSRVGKARHGALDAVQVAWPILELASDFSLGFSNPGTVSLGLIKVVLGQLENDWLLLRLGGRSRRFSLLVLVNL